MKVVHLDKEKLKPENDLAEEAKDLEKTIRDNPANDKALNRLMVIYRKLGEQAKELKVLTTAIRTYEEKVNKRQKGYNQKVRTISKAILKATGLADKKGNNLYEPAELAKWRKRKMLLRKKIVK